MSNLGSDTTPVKGQNFELPAGAQLDEESGDLVIRDSGGNIVFRRDEANGEWVVDSLNTEKLQNASDGDRPIFDGDGEMSVNVPGDFNTIQGALNAARVLNFDRYQINVEDGDYSSEDLVIGPALAHHVDRQNTETERSIRIVGNSANPENVKVGSIIAHSIVGICDVLGVEIDHENPYDDEGAGVIAYATHELMLVDVKINPSGTWDNTSNGSRAVESYSSNVHVKDFDLGSGVVADGFIAKREGVMDVAGPTTGHPNDKGFVSLTGSVLFKGNECTSVESANKLIESNGPVIDYQNDIQYGPNSFNHLSTQGVPEVSRYWNNGRATDVQGGEVYQPTNGVGTTSTTVMTNKEGDLTGRGGMAVVYGVKSDDDTIEFTDMLIYVAFGGVSVLGSDSRGSPASRSYSVSGHDLELSMGSDSYDVKSFWIGGTNN